MPWTFDKVKLSDSTNKTIDRLGFIKPTPVQTATIPLCLSHKDVVVEAVTGSGKTLAFLIPIIEMMLKRKDIGMFQVSAIVISPTRELAKQTYQVLNELLKDLLPLTPIKSITLIGGSGIEEDIEMIEKHGCNIVIATPGRLLGVLEKGTILNVKELDMLVLDEADRLLSLGFEKALNCILEKLPKQRRTGLFSATMSDGLTQLIRAGLRNPMRVTVRVENKTTKEEQKMPTTLCSYYDVCEYEHRLPYVLNYLKERKQAIKKSIIYFGTCAAVDYFGRTLPLLPTVQSANLPQIFALHGKMEHKKRIKVYQEFIQSESAILVCTDLAARGLDFNDIDLVIQYEAPQDPTTFVHRCGRTARSGRDGEALLLVSESEDAYVEFLHNRKIPLVKLVKTVEEEKVTGVDSKSSLFTEIRNVNENDRDFYEKSIKAFVAFIRFYQEHQAKFIFRLKDVDVVQVAKSFGLLRLPRMKELKGVDVEGFEESTANIADIKFKDKQRNKQRKQALEGLRLHKSKPKDDNTTTTTTTISTIAKFQKPGKNIPDQPIGNTKNKLDMGELDQDWKEFKKARKAKQ